MTSCTGAGGTGTKYTYAQLEQLWINAGGPSSVAYIAAAIALAESGGCTSALNLTDNNGTQTSVGLWQVSNGTHSYPSAWNTATGNAAEAVAKYKGAGGFSPWGTYTSGAYLKYLSPGTSPDSSLASIGQGLTGSTAAATSAAASDCLVGFQLPGSSFLQGLMSEATGANSAAGVVCLFSKSEARAIIGGLILLAGSGIMVLGLAVAVLNTRPGKVVAQAAGKAGMIAGEAVAPEAALAFASARRGKVPPARKPKRAPAATYSGWYASAERREHRAAPASTSAALRGSREENRRLRSENTKLKVKTQTLADMVNGPRRGA